MKFYSFIFTLFLLLYSCSKKEPKSSAVDNDNLPANYDTTAIDSFSNGALSVNIEQRIKQSSFAYQDSIKRAKITQDSLKKIQEMKQKLEAEEKKKEEQKEEAEKKQETGKTEKPETTATSEIITLPEKK